MGIKRYILRALNRHGYQLIRFPIRQFVHQYQFDLVLDVGANTGQFATELRREVGYRHRIVSFEPLSSAFEVLSRQADADPGWQAVNAALGSRAEESVINITGSSASSSLLELLPKHVEVAPHARVVSTETVVVKRLDDLFGELATPDARVLLKIDTQGFEMEVLKGAVQSLAHITGILIELNLCPLHAGVPMAEDVMSHLRHAGFEPYWFLPGLRDPRTQQLLQMDGFFIKREAPATGASG